MSNEANFSVNFIEGRPPQFTFRADTFEEWIANLTKVQGIPGASDALARIDGKYQDGPYVTTITAEQAVANVAAAFPAAVVEPPVYIQQPQQFAPVAPPQTYLQQPAAAVAGAKHCKHGAMVARSGTSAKTGKPWNGYFCPSPKGTPDQCDPEFGR